MCKGRRNACSDRRREALIGEDELENGREVARVRFLLHGRVLEFMLSGIFILGLVEIKELVLL